MSNAAGIACVAAGALLLSAKGIVAKLMYAQGADVDTVSAVRSVLAVAGFWAWACWRVGGSALVSVNPRHLLLAAGVGLLSYYVGAYVDFYALSLIDASLERVLLFSYPVLIVTVQMVVQRRLPPGRVLGALALTYAGVILAVGAFDSDLLDSNAWGAGLVLFCAATLAVFFLVNGRIGPLMGAQTFTTWAMTAAGLGFLIHFLVRQDLAVLTQQTPQFWWLMALMVVGVTVLPLFLVGIGVSRIGATRGGMISTLGPAATVVMAWLILDERLHPLQFLGSAMIVIGIFVLERRRN